MDKIKEVLEGLGIPYEKNAPYASFDNGDGERWVFPSQTRQTRNGVLVVRSMKKELVNTAEEALKACGVR